MLKKLLNLTDEQSKCVGTMMSYLVLLIGLYLAYTYPPQTAPFMSGIAFIAMALHEIID